MDRGTGSGPEPMVAVYVPTNHLYLGDVIICHRDKASYPDITVEQGIRIGAMIYDHLLTESRSGSRAHE